MRRFLLRLAWLTIFLCVPVQTAALAAEPAKPLTVQAVFEGELPLAGMRFDVYRVADRSGGGTWSLEPRFKAYQTRLETQSGDGNAWATLARVLEKVALMDEACLPDASAETDEDGTAVLDALRPGLYLLSGQSVCVNRQIYTPSPMLIVCPAECAAEPELTRSPEKADYSVQIVWDDEKTPEQRPGSLPVQLMCDGKAYGRPVLLSEEQDWHYTWSSLPTAHYWALAEQVVPGYLDAEVQKEGTVFRVTYAAAQPEPKPQPEAGEAPETGKRGWLAAPALILIAAAGIFLRNLRKKSKKA